MTPTELLSALRKGFDQLTAHHFAEDDERIYLRRDDVLALLPQILAAVEEGQVGVNEEEVWRKLFNAADRYCRREGYEMGFMPRDTIMATIRPFLRAPLPLPPSSPPVERYNAESTMNLDSGEITHERVEYRPLSTRKEPTQ